MNGYIYMLTDKRNGKKYIGKHNGSVKNYITGGKIPNAIIKKYGINIFERIILEDNIDSDIKLENKEKYYIEKYKTFSNGYNLTKGGDGGGSWIYLKTEEEKKRIVEIKRQKNLNKKVSKETRLKMSKSKKGLKLSESHRLQVIKNLSNRVEVHTEESKEKMRKAKLGKKASKKTRNKMSKTRIGKPIPGMSARLKENNPKAQKVSINGIVFKTIRSAAEYLSLQEDCVRARINSKSLNFKNWIRIV